MNMTARPAGRTEARPIYAIAQDIFVFWRDINPGARAYANAMLAMTTVRDHYDEMPGQKVVTGFLLNATDWQGPEARRVKAELKARI